MACDTWAKCTVTSGQTVCETCETRLAQVVVGTLERIAELGSAVVVGEEACEGVVRGGDVRGRRELIHVVPLDPLHC